MHEVEVRLLWELKMALNWGIFSTVYKSPWDKTIKRQVVSSSLLGLHIHGVGAMQLGIRKRARKLRWTTKAHWRLL
jgi:hypothetical protein